MTTPVADAIRHLDAAAPTDARAVSRRRRIAIGAMLVAIAVLVGVAGATTPSFLTFDNLLVVIRNASITGIVALGMSFVTISGNLFALSAEELAILAACVFAWLMHAGFGLAPSLGATLLMTAAGGAVQGAIIAVGADPIITTLAFGALFRGLASLVTGNQNIELGSRAAVWIGTGRPLGVPTQSWAFILLTLAAWFALDRTRFGRQVVLTGANRAAAAASGLRVGQAALVGVTLLGIGCGLVGISAASQFGLAAANLFGGLDIDVVAAILVGGIALAGGQGSPIQAALGATFIALMQNFMLLHDLSTGVRMVVVGCLVAAATCAFHVMQQRRA
ncbi:MAG: ABC transporter permease [Alphaproteobacteria bacterium]|nr:ABC transporter permease [Alphaproteobacteria bacterium]